MLISRLITKNHGLAVKHCHIKKPAFQIELKNRFSDKFIIVSAQLNYSEFMSKLPGLLITVQLTNHEQLSVQQVIQRASYHQLGPMLADHHRHHQLVVQ